MITLIFLSSGLFLGWSLGANDAANIFGTAVGTRMLKFKTAAIVGSIFVIIGAVVQGAGASHTLGKLGNVTTLAAAFTVALSAALTVYWMTKMSLPVSTSQAIVGAIIGWNFYTNNPTDINVLFKIVTTWVSGPVLGGIFAVGLFILVKKFNAVTKVHLLYRDSFIKFGLLIVGAFGAYSLGANNIANVMGVFVGTIDLPTIDLYFFELSNAQQLFLIGSIAISVGIITYSRHVMETVGNTLMPLTSDAAFVVVLSQALVLFIFSSASLSNALQYIGLPAIPLVPVSSSQVVIGSIIGIGLFKGGKEIKYNVLGGISLGWIATPMLAGIISFFMLFFVNNVFKQDVGGDRSLILPSEETVQNIESDSLKVKTITLRDSPKVENNQNEIVSDKDIIVTETRTIIILSLILGISVLLTFFLLIINIKQKRAKNILKKQIKAIEDKYQLQVQNLETRVKENIYTQDSLSKELKFRQNEMVTMAMNIIRKNEFMNSLKEEIVKIKANVKDHETRYGLNKLSLMIHQDLSIDRDRDKFQMHINEQNSNFIHRLSESFPSMTDNEKRLASLLRLNLSSKEIASILNISPKSVEMNRYRLRKKLKVNPKVNLSDFIRDF